MSNSSWVEGADGSPFPVQHLPYGIASHDRFGGRTVPVVAIGDHAVPLPSLHRARLLDDVPYAEVAADAWTLNPLMALGRATWTALRERLTELLSKDDHRSMIAPMLVPLDELIMHLPFEVADYVDFYSSEHHAENVGRIFRPDGDPLTPNWKHLPIGYHGRSGTVVVSGTDVIRPSGQRKPPTAGTPTFGPSVRLDIEAEVGFVIGSPSRLGTPVPAAAVRDHVFGVVLVNDWSARDIQAWEYVPLGPFLGKSFQTSISAWVTPLAALEPAMVTTPDQDPQPLPYLADAQWGLDLDLEVSINGTTIARPPFAQMYWTPAQQLAHLTINGASIRTGDLFASGTVSGPKVDQRGSLLELSWNGTEPITLDDGSTRNFLEDGDTVVISATAVVVDGATIGLGEVTGTIRPATRS